MNCPICKKLLVNHPIKPQMISKWDKENNFKRDNAWVCCGKVWLYTQVQKLKEHDYEK